MAQLSDDCFAFGGELLAVEEAARLMAEQVPAIVETEIVRLRDADGRVLAGDLIATLSVPAFDNSAVDGFAVRHADIAASGDTTLTVTGRVTAGQVAAALNANEAVRIFTGAPMPRDADTVYMQEDCRIDGDRVTVPAGLKRGANRRFAGEDIGAGEIAITAGRRLMPADIALAAALGFTSLTVKRRVRVALFSTGDEIVEPDTALPDAALYDSNRYHLMSLLARLGADTNDLGILPDNPARLAQAIDDAAANHDLILTSGGVSTGEADHVKTAVESIGRLVFWRLAIKPGRPVAMGVVNGTAFVGLPGNPAAVLVTFITIVRPLLMRLTGATETQLVPVPANASFHHTKKLGRREYLRVTATLNGAGVDVDKHSMEGAGLITSITRSTGLVVLDPDTTQIEPGARVDYFPWAVLLD